MLDEWFENEVKPRLRGEAHEIRFTDDAVLFQYREDAEKVAAVLPKRFAKFGLTLHPEKTRLVDFGRSAEAKAKRQGQKPATFDFPGFTHICARSRRGKFTVHVLTVSKRLRRGLSEIARWCQEHRHDPVGEQQNTLNQKLRGHYQYYGRPTNYRSLWKFYRGVRSAWRKWLSRRTRGLGENRCHGADSQSSYSGIPCCGLGSRNPGQCGELHLRNPLREIRTVGSVRGEGLGEPW